MTKRIDFDAPRRSSDAVMSIDKILSEWEYQRKIDPLLNSVIELKKEHDKVITGDSTYVNYGSMSGYLQALVTILGSKDPEDVIEWLKTEKEKLETELPFAALKHTGNK